MGKWAKSLFGKEKFEDIGIVVAGTNTPEVEKSILGFFDKVLTSKDSVYHAHLARKNGKDYPIVFNVYGAPAMVDVLTEMHDGGCRTIIFVGYAYGGFENLDVGTIVTAGKAYHFEGIYHHIEPGRRFNIPDKKLKKKIEGLFNRKNIKFASGPNISVPAVSFQLPHANKEYQRILPLTLEMELASCYSRAKDIGMRAAGILIVSDNRKVSIDNEKKRKLRHESKKLVLKTIIENIAYFKLPHLKQKKEFNIDEHLASIIESSTDENNVYRKNIK